MSLAVKFGVTVLLPALTYGYIGRSLESFVPNKTKVMLPLIATTVAKQSVAILFFYNEAKTNEKVTENRMILTLALPIFLAPYLLIVSNIYIAVMALAALYITTAIVNTFILIEIN